MRGDPLRQDHVRRIEALLRPLGLAAGEIVPLAQGANNVVYAFEAGGRSLVAKIGVNPGSRHLDQEWAFLRACPGIGPECLAFGADEEGSQAVIQERLQGEHPFALDAVGLQALGGLLKSYHLLPAPAGTPIEDWRGFAERRILPTPPDSPLPELAQMLARCLREALVLGESVPAAGTSAQVLVHGDLIPLNILQSGPTAFRIIDWEGLRLDEPEADVVTLFKAFRCGPTEQAALLRGYGPGLRPERLRFRRLLHDLQVAAWRLACQIPTAQGAELDKALAEAREELEGAKRSLGPQT